MVRMQFRHHVCLMCETRRECGRAELVRRGFPARSVLPAIEQVIAISVPLWMGSRPDPSDAECAVVSRQQAVSIPAGDPGAALSLSSLWAARRSNFHNPTPALDMDNVTFNACLALGSAS